MVKEENKKMERIKIDTEFIKLVQFLKWAGIAETGSEATGMIKGGMVKVNNEVEFQRGKKLRKGDTVEVGGKLYTID